MRRWQDQDGKTWDVMSYDGDTMVYDEENSAWVDAGSADGHFVDDGCGDDDGYSDDEGSADVDDHETELEMRAEEIIDWLSKSELAREFKKGEGFLVSRGPLVRLTDGTTIDLFDWLAEVGIAGGSIMAGYNVAYCGPDRGYAERLSFFKLAVVDAPFSRRSSEDLSEFDGEDISF